MSRVTCRCGEVIDVTSKAGLERVDCPQCGAKIRLRRSSKPSASSLIGGGSESADGFIRFYCPCGRRLKVRKSGGQQVGKCPDCGRQVPVPAESGALSTVARSNTRVDSDARTEELDAEDLAQLQEWSMRHTGRSPDAADGPDATPMGVPHIRVGPSPYEKAPAPSMVSFEAGLRVCPRCGKPVHISATTCRECGAAVPRR
jgi:DNA-directed RNA polymerase subunit M/transcription elongation factor TFIIS